jgi:DNA-binding transcriptional LysR family regulator
MRDLNDLFFFAAVVRHNGFASAARALRVPKSSLSRRVARLEDDLGVRLLERTARRFSVTEVGQDFYQRCQALVEEAEAAEDAAARAHSAPQGLVRASCPPGLSRALATEVLPAFLKDHPQVRVQLIVSNRRVDLIEERIDVAIRVRIGLNTDAELTMRALGRSRHVLVASPELMPQIATDCSPQNLSRLPTLGLTEELGTDTWLLIGPQGLQEVIEHEPRLSSCDFAVILQAALEGLGIALLPEQMVGSAIRSGRLVRALPEWHGGERVIHLVFTSRRSMRPAVRALIDALADAFPELSGRTGLFSGPDVK